MTGELQGGNKMEQTTKEAYIKGNYDSLVESFIKINSEAWDRHVYMTHIFECEQEEYEDNITEEGKLCVFGCGKVLDVDHDFENSCRKCE